MSTSLSRKKLKECNAIARLLGVTPKFNDEGEINPIGAPETKGRVYVVFRGRAIGLFYNWGIVKAMVYGYSGCAYKKYPNLESGRTGWMNGPFSMQDWVPPAPREADCVVSPTPPPSPPAALPLATLSLPQRAASPTPRRSSVSEEESDHFPPRTPSRASHSSLSDREDVTDHELSAALTPGTVSRELLSTPRVPLPSLTRDSPVVSRTLSCGIGRRDSPIRRATQAPGTSRAPQRPSTPSVSTVSAQHGSPTPRKGKGKGLGRKERDWVVPQGREIFVVVRGAHPGIYFDRNAAIFMLGTHPSMKLAIFDSLSKGAWYFVLKYMEGEVGVTEENPEDEETFEDTWSGA